MYDRFAVVYDQVMKNVQYEKWARRIEHWLATYGNVVPLSPPPSGTGPKVAEKEPSAQCIIVELGCGTGTMTEMLAARGFDMIGIDAAEAMLAVAMDKKLRKNSQTLYLCQDMREIDLYGTVQGFVCIFDSLNYLLSEADLLKTFRRINTFLQPGGLFIFDFNTIAEYQSIGNATYAADKGDFAYIWENFYYANRSIKEIELTLFIKDDNGHFWRHCETHLQRGYNLPQIKRLLDEAGLSFVHAVDDVTDGPPGSLSGRVVVVAKSA